MDCDNILGSMRELDEMNHKGIDGGKWIGQQDQASVIAGNLLGLGFPIEVVAKVTSLNEEIVKVIKEKGNNGVETSFGEHSQSK